MARLQQADQCNRQISPTSILFSLNLQACTTQLLPRCRAAEAAMLHYKVANKHMNDGPASNDHKT